MGSFLWPFSVPVIRAEINQILLSEVKWLKINKPTLLGVNDMLQDDLNNYVKVVGLPWFEKNRRKNEMKGRKVVYFTAGATGIHRKELIELIHDLKQINPTLEVAVDPHIYNEINENLGVSMFDFREKSFTKLKAVVCRPGMGILNDAVKYGIPVFAVHDWSNDEIKYNASRVVDHGIGLELGFTRGTAKKINSHLNNEPWLSKIKNAFINLTGNGQRMAAEYIIDKVYENSKV